MSKRRLSLEERREIGLALASIRDELVVIGTRIANAFPLPSPAVRAALFAKYIDDARSLLDAEVGDPAIYYPTPDERCNWWAKRGDEDFYTARALNLATERA